MSDTTNSATVVARYLDKDSVQADCDMHHLNLSLKVAFGLIESTRSRTMRDSNGNKINGSKGNGVKETIIFESIRLLYLNIINPFDHVISEFFIKPSDMPSLSPPTQAPSYSTLRAFQKALNHNAMSIHSPQTDLGHLSLVISKEKYLKVSNNIEFVAPTDQEDDNQSTTTPSITTRCSELHDHK